MSATKSQFIISLDFELFWGVRDKFTLKYYGENIRGVQHVIPALLDVFNRYEVEATFATVGFLFARNRQDLLEYIPPELPAYSDSKYSPYENDYLKGIGNSEEDDIIHFGESLLRMIHQDTRHEIATHTFSHFYCLEKASLSSFEEDIKAARRIADNYGVNLKSIVFPRNQYSQEHVDICRRLGFISFRGNQQSLIYNPRSESEQNRLIRGTRLLDSFLNLTGHHTFTPVKENGMVNLPASRFLRPYSPKFKAIENLRLQRIKKGMTHAAKNSQAYHLWWHPHNFGVNLKENLASLENILKHYKMLEANYGMKSKTMKAISEEILEGNGV
jgi:peptidoglycan/xylan/chitin deacetylase (PgdA/CDA1 family)